MGVKRTSKTTTVVTKVDTYHISSDIKMVVTNVNGEETSRVLKYTGKIKRSGVISPIYDVDMEYLKRANPFQYIDENKNGEWFKGKQDVSKLNPEDIDVSKIILTYTGNHELFTLDGTYIPYLQMVEFNNRSHRIKKLHEFLINNPNPNIVEISNVKEAPYWSDATLEMQIWFIPKTEWLYEVKENPNKKQMMFSITDEIKYGLGTDFLNINQFKKDEDE